MDASKIKELLAQAGIEVKDGQIAPTDLDKVMDVLEPYVAQAADEPEKIVKDEMCIDWLWERAGVKSDGVFALEKWLEHVDKGEANTLAQMKDVLESFKSDIEEYCLPACQEMLDEIETLESSIEDGDVELVDEEDDAEDAEV